MKRQSDPVIILEEDKVEKRRGPLVIKISDYTAILLMGLKHPGQTWDGIIQELIEEHDKQIKTPPMTRK